SAPRPLSVIALSLLPDADDQHLLRTRRRDVEESDLLRRLALRLGRLHLFPAGGLRILDDAEALARLPATPPVPERMRSVAVDEEAHRRIVLAARVGEEDDGRLEPLRAVDGHQPHRAAASGPRAPLFDVAGVREPLALGHHAR